MLISQHKCLVNPKYQEMLYFAYGWHITSQSLGLSNSLSINQRSELLKHAGLLRVLSARLIGHSPKYQRDRYLRTFLSRCLVHKVQIGLTLQHLFSLSSQFLVTNPLQGISVNMCFRFGLLLICPKPLPFVDVDFTGFDPSFSNFLKELALVSEIMRLFQAGNFMLCMILDTVFDTDNLGTNPHWLKYINPKSDIQEQHLISFYETFSRLTKLYESDETIRNFEPIFRYYKFKKSNRRYPYHEAALVVFCLELLKRNFVDYNNFCKKIDVSHLSPSSVSRCRLEIAFRNLRTDGLTLVRLPLSGSIVSSEQPTNLSVILDALSDIIIPKEFIKFLENQCDKCLSNKHPSVLDYTKYRHECTSKYVRFMLILTKLIEMIQSRNAHFFQLLLLWQDAQIATQSHVLLQTNMVDLLNVLKKQIFSDSKQFDECQSILTMMLSFTKFEHDCIYQMLSFLFRYLSKPGMTKYLKKYMESQTNTSSFFESLDKLIKTFEQPRPELDLTDFKRYLLYFDNKRCRECRKWVDTGYNSG
jgi:hypothetical protein